MLVQIITPHIAVVTVENGGVKSEQRGYVKPDDARELTGIGSNPFIIKKEGDS